MTSTPPNLSASDARVLNALMEEGLDPAGVSDLTGEDRRRGEALLQLLGKLDQLPAEAPRAELLSSLKERIDVEEHAQRDRLRLNARARTPRRLRIPDVVTIAAVLLLAIGVGWPLASTIRSATLREQCERNLVSVHAGLDRFASDHDGRLPLTAAFASFLQPSVTPSASRDAAVESAADPSALDWRQERYCENLELLRDREYLGARCLTCPGCEKERGALALRVPAAGQRFTRTEMTGMLVADANPAIELLRSDEPWQPGATISSLNHRSLGQNILFDDGSVRWLLSPVLINGDSIWTPGDGSTAGSLEHGSRPANPNDIFLAQ